MDFVEGTGISDGEARLAAGTSPAEVARTLIDAFADGLYKRAVLHADPHPGNLLVQGGPGGPRLVLLDHGLTMDLEPSFVATLSRMVGRSEERRVGQECRSRRTPHHYKKNTHGSAT